MKAQICCKAVTICAGLSAQDDIRIFYLFVYVRSSVGCEQASLANNVGTKGDFPFANISFNLDTPLDLCYNKRKKGGAK